MSKNVKEEITAADALQKLQKDHRTMEVELAQTQRNYQAAQKELNQVREQLEKKDDEILRMQRVQEAAQKEKTAIVSISADQGISAEISSIFTGRELTQVMRAIQQAGRELAMEEYARARQPQPQDEPDAQEQPTQEEGTEL